MAIPINIFRSLPSGSDCPGGNESWASTERTNNSVICLNELNLCIDHNGKLYVLSRKCGLLIRSAAYDGMHSRLLSLRKQTL